MNQLTVALTDEERAVELEACEKRIFSAFRRGLEATCDIGKELVKIEAGKLYDVRGYDDLMKYAERELRMDQKAVTRSMGVLSVIELLEGAGIAMPSNESQLVELAKLPDEQVVPVWEKLVKACDKQDVPVTVLRVREAVNLERKPLPPRPGVKTTLKMDEPLSEVGERALGRIRRICGEEVAQAIESGIRSLSERAIVRWAELKDQAMRNLIYYVIDQGWSVADAIAYEDKKITADSRLGELVMLARARGGHVAIQHEEFLVTFDRNAVAA